MQRTQKPNNQADSSVESVWGFKHMRIHVLEDGISVATRKQEYGSSETTINASVSGGVQECIVNPRYIYEGISCIERSEVFLGINSASAPVVLRGSDTEGVDSAFTYVVMPIKSAS